MNEVEIINDINKAVALLKSHKLLLNNDKSFFYEKMGKVLVLGNNSKYSLTYDEFISLYSNTSFVEFDDKDDSIDFDRDAEYYSWKHK